MTATAKQDTPSRKPRLPGRDNSGEPRPPRGAGQAFPLVVVAIALIAAGIGAIIVSNAYDTPNVSRALGPNLAINDGASNPLDLSQNNSPTLVRNPVDTNNLAIAARVDAPTYSCTLHVSFDGGGRWTQTPIPAPLRVQGPCFAADAAFSTDGTLYVTYATLKGRANAPDAVWISRSTDGGKTLGPPVKTPLGARAFQVRITADPTAPKRIFLTWLKADELGLYTFSNTGNPIMAIRSDDGGINWTAPSRVSSPTRARVVSPSPSAGSKAGELNVLYLDLGDDVLDYGGGHRGRGGPPYSGTWQLVLARSTDNGATWKESVVEDAVTPTERFIVFTPPYPAITVDRDSGRTYAAFQDGRGASADVLLWSLPRGGDAWSGPVRVNDTPAKDGTSQYLPQMAVAPNGRLDVLYYDRRADRTNVLNEVSLQSSYDDGQTFGPRVLVSDHAFSSRIGSGAERKLPDLGSRIGLLSTDTRAFGVWTDTRNGSVRSGKQDLARGVVGFNDPPRISSAAETALLLGGIVLILLGVAAGVGALSRRRRTA